MSAPTQVKDGAGKGRQLTKAEKVLFGLARSSGDPVYYCGTHPIFVGKGGICPKCGGRGNRFQIDKEAPNA